MSLRYRKSTFSNFECVEVAPLPDGTFSLRDSKDRTRPPHVFTAQEWAAFVAGVKDSQFDFGLDTDAVRGVRP